MSLEGFLLKRHNINTKKLIYIAVNFLILLLPACGYDMNDHEVTIKYLPSSSEGSITCQQQDGKIEVLKYDKNFAANLAISQGTTKKIVRIGTFEYDGTATIYINTEKDHWQGKLGNRRLIIPSRPEYVFKTPDGKLFVKEFYYDIKKWGWTNVESEKGNEVCDSCPSL
jgi:hypothetical protein